MNLSSKFLTAASIIALGLAANNTTVNAADEEAAKEKCYGVVKAGANDCASADGAHSCAGQASEDANANEWVLVPEGLCDKLSGGSKEAPKS